MRPLFVLWLLALAGSWRTRGMAAAAATAAHNGAAGATAARSTARGMLAASMQPNNTQTSNPLDPALDPVVYDIPLDQPPVARTASGWEPEGVHLTLWADNAVLVSWQTGEPRIGPSSSPPPPHSTSELAGLVRYGTASGQLRTAVAGGKGVTYSYAYDESAGGMTYRSPILHHVLIRGLAPGQTYWYRVGGVHRNGTAAPDSQEFEFRLPPAPPSQLRVGVIGDPGQTYNTSQTLQQLAASRPDVVLVLGDLSYADLYFSNQTDTRWSFPGVATSQQLRWDALARLAEPLLASVPAIHVGGNHEVEPVWRPAGSHQQLRETFTAFNARYPQPQDPLQISTLPNVASHYLNASEPLQFVNVSEYQPQNAYWAVDLPLARFVVLNSYLPYGPTSRQFHWAAATLGATNRTATPWLIVLLHAAPRTTYSPMFQENEEFMQHYEPLFYQAQVDLVLSGHVHSYERSLPLFNYTVDACGTAYITVGDGGNAEGPETRFIDTSPLPFCSNASLYMQPTYQPTSTGQPTLTFRGGRLCPTAQPDYSAFRDPSFGHGLLVLHNGTTAEWAWQANKGSRVAAVDEVVLRRKLDCPAGAAALAGRLPSELRQQRSSSSGGGGGTELGGTGSVKRSAVALPAAEDYRDIADVQAV